MDGKIKYEFTTTPWQYEGKGAWIFVTLPIEIASEIRTHFKWMEEGWGRLKATAQIGQTKWETAIWFDTKKQTYLLPLKTEIRKKENISTSIEIEIFIWV